MGDVPPHERFERDLRGARGGGPAHPSLLDCAGGGRCLLSGLRLRQSERACARSWSCCGCQTRWTADSSSACFWLARPSRPRPLAMGSRSRTCAIPVVLHVGRPSLALCFLERPIEYGALDGKPVNTLFTIISPTTRAHLHLMSKLSFVLRDPGVRQAIEAQESRRRSSARSAVRNSALASPKAGLPSAVGAGSSHAGVGVKGRPGRSVWGGRCGDGFSGRGGRAMQLTVRDVSRFLNVPESTVTRWIKQRGLPSQHVGGQYRFNRVELLEWATANRDQGLRGGVRPPGGRRRAGPEPGRGARSRRDLLPGARTPIRSSPSGPLVELLPLPEGVDRELLLRLFLAREASASTAIGDGIALPHVRNPIVLHVERPMVTLCFLEQPVDFGALDGKPVHVLFSLICPTMRSHLQILSRLSYALHDEKFKEVVIRQGPREEILREARRVEAALAAPATAREGEPVAWTSWLKHDRSTDAGQTKSRGGSAGHALRCGRSGLWVCVLALVPTLRVLGGGPPESLRLDLGCTPRGFLHRIGRSRRLLPAAGPGAVHPGGRLWRQLPARLPRQEIARSSWFFFNMFVVGMIMVVIARTALLFLLSWEVMSLSAFFLVTFEHEKAEVRRAGWVYLVATHLGVAFLFATFVLLGRHAGSLEFEAFDRMPASGCRLVGADLCPGPDRLRGEGGFCSLSRLAARSPSGGPFARLGLDVGRDDQDGPLRAVARPDLPRAPAPWWGLTLAGLGLLTALVGVSLALHQRDLKRVLAYSSIENMGLIGLALGVGLWGRASRMPVVAALGMAAGLLHIWNHALMKGLMFLAAGSVLHGTGTKDMEKLGGLMKRMPWTGGVMMVGAVAICGPAAVERLRQRMADVPEPDEVRARDERRPRPDGPPGRRPPRAGRRPGRDHLRSTDGHRAVGLAAERSRPARPRVLALDARADGAPGLPLPDRGS